VPSPARPSLRFLVSRRWVLFFLVVVVLAYGTWWLGRWQFHRLEDRQRDNAVVERNEDAAPVPVGEVLAPGRDVDPDDEWRAVTATGSYVTDETVIVRYRTREGSSGVDVVVPLQTDGGPALLVDRGWLATDNSGAVPDDVPAPPAGEVTVTGYVRVDATGDSAKVSDRSTRSISSEQIGSAIGREVYAGFVVLASEDPAPDTPLLEAELPDLGNGPHFFYGLQWWFFGLLAVFGFLYLAYDEWRGGPKAARRQGQSARSMPPSTGSITPVTKDEAGESRKAAARPNSSGSP
jgi:cytochrome oxidase assembly protein ShyY1